MLVEVYGSAVLDLEATTASVEEKVDSGIRFHLLGHPERAVIENNSRIATALKKKGRSFPGEKSTLNMAPADLRKEGSASDLPLAMGILVVYGLETDDFQIFFKRDLFPLAVARCSGQGLNILYKA